MQNIVLILSKLTIIRIVSAESNAHLELVTYSSQCGIQ